MKIEGYAHDVEIILILKNIGIKIRELPVKWKHRSNSKISVITDSLIMFLDLFILKLRFSLNY